MPSTYSSLLRFELQANGENANTWGTKTNNNLTLIENKIASYLEVVLVNGTNTLSANDGSSDQNRRATLEFTGALTSAASVEVKAVANWWIMKNSTTGGQTLTVQTSLGTGFVLDAGDARVLWTDGTTVEAVGIPVSVSLSFAHINTLVAPSVSITGGNIVGAAVSGGSINGAPIGATAPSSATFLDVSATSIVASVARFGVPLSVTSGGTGLAAVADGAILVGASTGTLVPVAPSVTGTALLSNGLSVAPSYQAIPRVTSIVAGTGLTGGTITSSGTIALDTTHGNVGTYVLATYQAGGSITITYGTQVAGSDLVPSRVAGNVDSPSALSGTWQCMGHLGAISETSSKTECMTLWMRIS